MSSRKINVLIVDDSALIRRVLTLGLNQDPQIEVMGAASSAEMARRHIARQRPDVITLDLEMPEMDGLSFLKSYINDDPIPTVVISSLTQSGAKATIDALQAGAVDVLPKPAFVAGLDSSPEMKDICRRVKVASKAHVVTRPAMSQSVRPMRTESPVLQGGFAGDWIIGIGASTGGVQALADILPKFPRGCPGIVIVQHMPEGFTGPFARRLSSLCDINVVEAKHGDIVKKGTAYIAPGGTKHMIVQKAGADYMIKMIDGDPACFSRPSVDVLFSSIAKEARSKSSAVILTGMGKDGAQGLLEMRENGGATFAQDKESCVVFGMPSAAQNLGATETMLSLEFVADNLLRSIGSGRRNLGSRGASTTSFGR